MLDAKTFGTIRMLEFPMSKLPLALQMYTVRDDAARDLAATLAQIKRIGYAGVELAGFYNHSVAEVRQMLDEYGLVAYGTHTALEVCESSIDQVIADHRVLGCQYVAIPYLADKRRQSMADYEALAESLNTIGKKLSDAGLTLCYHNHAFEFETFGGEIAALDVLFSRSNPEFVKVELDTFWVKKAGIDPATYMGKYPGRIPILHLKDMTPEPESTFAPVGTGIMDYPSLFAAAPAAGVALYVVEQDSSKSMPPLEAVEISFNNLVAMGMVG